MEARSEAAVTPMTANNAKRDHQIDGYCIGQRLSMESFLYRKRTFLIVGIMCLMGMNIMYGRNAASLYRIETESDVIDLPILKAPTSNRKVAERKKTFPGPRLTNIPHYENAESPACKPHFQVANRPMQPLQWSNFTRFKRFYFYHARKAGKYS